MENAHNKRRQSRAYRADFWDYSFSGAYFVTINLLDRRPLFGTIRSGKSHFHRWEKLPFIAGKNDFMTGSFEIGGN